MPPYGRILSVFPFDADEFVKRATDDESTAVYALGFFLRVPVRENQNSLGLFIVMQLFLVCSPAAFLAFNYIVYGRLIQENVGAKYSLIRPSIVARVFVISDVVTFLVQVSHTRRSLVPIKQN